MASKTLQVAALYPNGLTVNVYLASDWSTGTFPTYDVAPPGSAATSAVVSGGQLALTGLTASTEYVAGAQVGGHWRYVHFDTSVPTLQLGTTSTTAAAGNDSRFSGLGTPNAQTGNYTLVLSDAGLCVEVSNAATKTVTVPTNASVAFPVGTVIEVARMGAGAVNVAAAGGVTIRSRGSLLGIANQYSSVSLRQRAADEWVLVGDLA